MSHATERYRVGEVRPSQLLYTFGVGSVIDLPNLSVMIMGLDEWTLTYADEIGEERLLHAVQEQLGLQVKALRRPPLAPDLPGDSPFDAGARIGVPVSAFPRWMLCPHCRLLAPVGDGRFELRPDPVRPDQSRYVHAQCSKKGAPPTVLPSRFLVACEKGHLDDFPWQYFVHGGPSECNGALRLNEYGVSGEAADIFVRCDTCQVRRPLSDAFGESGRQSMPACRGRHPHLRDFAEHGCDQQMRAILLGASNSWFGLTLTALSVPQEVDRLPQLVDAHWHILEKAGSLAIMKAFRDIGQLPAFVDYDDEAIWAAIERKRSGAPVAAEAQSLKAPEWQVFTNPDRPSRLPDFQIRAVPPPAAYAHLLTRVVLAEKLREVSAVVGFTRISSPGDFAEGDEIPPDHRAPLSRQAPQWVPAGEVRGEGMFLQFDEAAIQAWHERSAVQQLGRELFHAHVQWRRARRIANPTHGFPGMRYMVLHSFAHALIRRLSLECGYTTASLRERIYALGPDDDDGPMAGILIYTAAPDSEGTLGGLVSMGEPQSLGRHIAGALEAMQLCASDPLCAEHSPLIEPITLHAAACHACMFVPETSCERGNRYLDRALLVPTVEQRYPGVALFEV
jgi:hypothetical protein